MGLKNIADKELKAESTKALDALFQKYNDRFTILVYNDDEKEAKIKKAIEKCQGKNMGAAAISISDADKLGTDDAFTEKFMSDIDEIFGLEEDNLSDKAKELLKLLRKKCKGLGFSIGNGMPIDGEKNVYIKNDPYDNDGIGVVFTLEEFEELAKEDDWDSIVKKYKI